VTTKTRPTLIPRKLFFGNPDKAMLRLSPDGKYLTYLADLDSVLNIWLASRDDIDNAKAITKDKGRGIQFYMWAYTNKHVLYIQDKDGDENWHLYSVDVETLETKDLTPFENVHTQLLNVNPDFPEHVVIGLNNRDPQWHDVYRLNIATGEMELLEQHDRFSSFLVDDKQTIRFAFASTPEGNRDMFVKNAGPNKNTGWELWDTIPQEDALTTFHFEFDKSGEHLFISDSRRRNTSAFFKQNTVTKEKTLLAENLKADLSNALIHPTNKNVQAVSFNYEREEWKILDEAIREDFDYLKTVEAGELEIVNRSLDDGLWIVIYLLDNGPGRYYLYERAKRQATFLFSNRKELEGVPLANMHSFVMKARDGLELVGYYSLPLGSDSKTRGIPDKPLPMVFTPHGGPWWRDSWGFNPWHSWLTNRGYAVMTINFRASTGFGKALTNAGDLEWGGKIIEDQVDAVQWCTEKGIADKNKIAIMGGSFGGFSVLAGLTFYPELYACGVDLVGVSNLMTFMETIPPYWKTEMELLYKRVGDPRTEEGKALLEKHSPVNYTERISKPLLIAQGANDPRVNKDESDQVINAMKAKNIPVTYLLYPDEGHGMARPENRLSFYALAEAFLAKCLGGASEEIGDDLKGSSMQLLESAEDIPGLQPLQPA
jgi:dipeptidyl aminopeptidase/acylaminoacyl peptidase